MSIIGRTFEQAIKKGQDSMQKNVDNLTAQNNEIIDKLNWIMITQQKICDHLNITLDDPLELDDEEESK